MNERIINLELDGKPVLGFDTGLNAQAFAQAKMAHFITNPGTIVYPDGKIELWQPGGVSAYLPPEHTPSEIIPDGISPEAGSEPTMVVWGPDFRGEGLLELINTQNRNDEALDAIRFWLKARMVIEENRGEAKEEPYPGPAGALIVTGKTHGESADLYPAGNYQTGTVFFPPGRLLKRTLESQGDGAVLEAERWIHPGLEKKDAISFSAASMLYRVFSGSSPFNRDYGRAGSVPLDELRQDIREAVYIPPALAAPGLDPELSNIITQSLGSAPQKSGAPTRPSPDSIANLLGPPGSRPVSSWIKPLTKEEHVRIRAEMEQYSKKKALEVKTRRFIIRNTAIIAGALIAVVVALLIVRGQIQHRAEMPTTMGMTPAEVAETYYGAFGELDHTLMDACVTGKAGKGDIETVINFFVTSRMRMAYESDSAFLSAREWSDSGRPDTNKTVFGVTDLKTEILSMDEANGKASLLAEYILWLPGSLFNDDENADGNGSTAVQNPEEMPPPVPVGLATRDILGFVYLKDCWRISEIDRESGR